MKKLAQLRGYAFSMRAKSLRNQSKPHEGHKPGGQGTTHFGGNESRVGLLKPAPVRRDNHSPSVSPKITIRTADNLFTMKTHLSALCCVLLFSLAMAKTIPTPEPVSAVTAKKTLVQEDTKKPEASETPVPIAVEDAEEPKQADRAKKSASTTFCVEIRPGQQEAPVKVCEENQPAPPPPSPPHVEPETSQIPHEIHHDIPHQDQPHPGHEQIFLAPPNPFVVIPNEQQSFVYYPPQFGNPNPQIQNPQQIICPGSSQQIFIASTPGSGPSQPQFLIPSTPGSGPSQPQFLIPSTPGSGPSQPQFLIPSTPGSGSTQPQYLIPSTPGSGPSQPQFLIPSTPGSGPSQPQFLTPSTPGSGPSQPQFLIPSTPGSGPSQPQFLIPSTPGSGQSQPQFLIPSTPGSGPSRPQFLIPSTPGSGPSQPQFLIPSTPGSGPSQPQFVIPSTPGSGPSQPQFLIPSTPGSGPSQPQFLIPSTPGSGSNQHQIFISSTSLGPYPQGPSSQNIVLPSGGGSTCHCHNNPGRINPLALLSLYRSGMAPHDTLQSVTMEEAMRMRSSSDSLSGMNSGTTSGTDSISHQGGPFGRTHSKKLYTVPITPYSSTTGGSSPYVVQCNPQVLSLGTASRMRDASEGTAMNTDSATENTDSVGESGANLGMSPGGRHIIHPVIQPVIHTSPGIGYDSYHSSPAIYHEHSSSVQTYESNPSYISHHGGYHAHPASFYREKEAPGSNMRTSDSQQQLHEKSWSQEGTNVERTSSGHQSMSPSQMLNQMRGANSGPIWREGNSMMHTFPREHEEKPSKDDPQHHHATIHIPQPGPPFMANPPELHRVGSMHEDMGKREAEKSAGSDNDA